MTTPIYIEVGPTKTFASAVEWPGWARSGKSEEAALATLLEYAPRYATVVRRRVSGFAPGTLEVVERVRGDAGTDFGVPGQHYRSDTRPITGDELERQLQILRACWDFFARVAAKHDGAVLRLGPRGGGRDLDKVVEHALSADIAYVSAIGGKVKPELDDPSASLRATHRAFEEALRGRIAGTVPAVGPRGGARWPLRFALRYVAWHSTDHAWEIEDRAESPVKGSPSRPRAGARKASAPPPRRRR
jgi:hypothetical protein